MARSHFIPNLHTKCRFGCAMTDIRQKKNPNASNVHAPHIPRNREFAAQIRLSDYMNMYIAAATVSYKMIL